MVMTSDGLIEFADLMTQVQLGAATHAEIVI